MKNLCLLICCLFCLSAASQNKEIRVASYNLRLGIAKDGENIWSNRKEMVKSLIVYHNFDIFGTQEGYDFQLKDICELGNYTYTGHGREDGVSAGEHSAIFYKKDRFKLLNSGDFWLSETPDVPGKGWDANCCNRICSWGKFKDTKSKKEFFFFNVHFDHEGVIARKESGKLMVQKIKEIAGKYPVICTGDFNSTPETEQIKTMQLILHDSYLISSQKPYGPVGTFNGFKFTTKPDHRIDYIFTDNRMKVLKYAVLTDSQDDRFPSDHFPVVVDLVW
jgi:endonuclease/exonuclease/phosphatase family metal-dependent hydrolase